MRPARRLLAAAVAAGARHVPGRLRPVRPRGRGAAAGPAPPAARWCSARPGRPTCSTRSSPRTARRSGGPADVRHADHLQAGHRRARARPGHRVDAERRTAPSGRSSCARACTFHDGTPFNAEAVCFNFDRWFNLSNAAAQSQAIVLQRHVRGLRQEPDRGRPATRSTTPAGAPDPNTAVITLNRAKGAFPAAFGLTSLSISSPTALQQYNADKVEQSGEAFAYTAYANEHPTGTGPFKFESYDQRRQHRHAGPQRRLLGREGQVDRADLQDHPGRDRPQAGAAGRHDRRLRPAEPGRLGGAEGRRLQRPGPPAVQHPLPGHQPEEQPGAAATSGSARRSPTRSTASSWSQPAARGRRGRHAVHARHRRGYAPTTCSQYAVRPGEGQGAAGRGRRRRT